MNRLEPQIKINSNGFFLPVTVLLAIELRLTGGDALTLRSFTTDAISFDSTHGTTSQWYLHSNRYYILHSAFVPEDLKTDTTKLTFSTGQSINIAMQYPDGRIAHLDLRNMVSYSSSRLQETITFPQHQLNMHWSSGTRLLLYVPPDSKPRLLRVSRTVQPPVDFSYKQILIKRKDGVVSPFGPLSSFWKHKDEYRNMENTRALLPALSYLESSMDNRLVTVGWVEETVRVKANTYLVFHVFDSSTKFSRSDAIQVQVTSTQDFCERKTEFFIHDIANEKINIVRNREFYGLTLEVVDENPIKYSITIKLKLLNNAMLQRQKLLIHFPFDAQLSNEGQSI